MTAGANNNQDDLRDDRMSAGTKVGIFAAIGVAVLVLALGLLGAQAPSSTAGSAPTTVPSTSAPSAHKAGEVTVDVQADEYSFKSPVTTFKVGVPYHFVVHNAGRIPHEFMLVEPIAPGMMSMEQMDSMAMGHIESTDLDAEKSGAIDVTFTKAYPVGTLEMACHVGQHYEKGMRLPIVVTS